MSSGTEKNYVRVLLDTNILISALGFKGKPREILLLILNKSVLAVISPILLAELQEVISKKFPKIKPNLPRIERKLRRNFTMIQPQVSIKVVRDEDDNRVLEAAIEGGCDFIITGDKNLLDLGEFKKIKIIRASEFLDIIQL